jgi:SAM-dependent methyltransferase
VTRLDEHRVPDGWRAYDDDPRRFFDRYEAVRFERVHRGWLGWLPGEPGAALDVGAGSGRDAAALAARGWRVVAAEPSGALRSRAAEKHDHPRIRWVADHLPRLEGTRALGLAFDLILVSAVWMHLPAREARRAMRDLAGLLRPGGRLVLSYRQPPDEDRAQRTIPRNEIPTLARDQALRLLEHRESEDAEGRAVAWHSFVLERRVGAGFDRDRA